MSFFGRSFILQRIARWFDFTFSPKGFFDSLIKKYHPGLIFSTDIHNENDAALMFDAKKAGIKILGMWRSWDNPTQQMLRIFPDVIFCGSEELRRETIELHNYPKERIRMTGHPHYDRYIKGPTRSREKFFSNFGLDPFKPFILFAPGGDKIIQYNDTDVFALEILAELEHQVLVRYPPGEDVRLIDVRTWPKRIVFEKPAHRFSSRPGDLEIRREDDDNLIDELHYASLVVTGPTSIPLDAALLDKPSIVADIYPTERNRYEKGWGYMLDHIQKLFSTGGVWRVRSKEDFIKAVKAYLENPSIHKEGRAEIRRRWFSHADGKASERLANEIISSLL